jgi:hypothetical protein
VGFSFSRVQFPFSQDEERKMHGTFSVSHQIEPAILYFGTPWF